MKARLRRCRVRDPHRDRHASNTQGQIGDNIEPHVIIGACNPTLASRALKADPQIGVLLPCNVVVRQSGKDVIVEAMDPGLMATITGNDDIAPIANEARTLVNDAPRPTDHNSRTNQRPVRRHHHGHHNRNRLPELRSPQPPSSTRSLPRQPFPF